MHAGLGEAWSGSHREANRSGMRTWLIVVAMPRLLLSTVLCLLAPASPQAVPEPPALSTKSYYFLFTGVRGGATTTELQLAEVKLYDLAGAELVVLQASNPGGAPYRWWEGASSAVDNDPSTKWLDLNCSVPGGGQRSLLRLTMAATAQVASYDFVTANHQPNRDPTDWTFGLYHDDRANE
eukprot:4863285-Prymnesium_polylepis.1